MAISLKELGIDQLMIDDRLALVREIWNSIAVDSPDVPLTDSQRVELDRQLADHQANPEDVNSWNEVKASIFRRLKK